MNKNSIKEVETYIAIMDNLPNYEKLYFKIGRTINRTERLRQLKNANPFIKTILIHKIDCELYLKHSLKKYNIQNEWFSIKSKDIKDITLLLQPLINEFYEQE
jgi:hypothetical protein